MKVRNSPQAYAGIGILFMLASTLLSACNDRTEATSPDAAYTPTPTRRHAHNTDHAYAYSHQHAHPYRHGNTCPDRYLGSKRVRGHA